MKPILSNFHIKLGKLAIAVLALLLIGGRAWGVDFNSATYTNVNPAPNDFTGWAAESAGISVVADQAAAPDASGQTADLVQVATTDSVAHFITLDIDGTAKTYRQFEIYAKANNWTWARFGLADTSNTFKYVYVNLVTGATGTITAGLTASVTDAGGGWWLIKLRLYQLTSGFTGTQGVRVILDRSDGGSSTFSGVGLVGSGVYVWGATLGTLNHITYTLGTGGDYAALSNFQAAITAQPGDTIDGQSQEYRATAIWSLLGSGTSGNQITYKNIYLNGGKEVAAGASWVDDTGGQYHLDVTGLLGTSNVVHGVVLKIGNAFTGTLTKFIRKDNTGALVNNSFYFDADADVLYVKMATNPALSAFELSYITTNSSLLYSNNADYITFDNVKVFHGGSHGLHLYESTNNEIKNSDYSYNADDGLHGTGACTATTIYDNVFSYNGEDLPAVAGYGDGISFHDTGTGSIYGNTILNNFKAGIANLQTCDFVIHHNYFYGNMWGWTQAPSIFHDNVVVFNANSTINKGIYVPQNYTGTSSAYNNTIVGYGTPNNSSYGVYLNGDGTESGTFIFKNNIVFNVGTGVYKDAGFEGTFTEDYNCVSGSTNVDYAGLSAGDNSVTTNPLLSPTHSLGTGSPAIGSGVPILTYAQWIAAGGDFAGKNPTGGKFDMGAYQTQRQKSDFPALPIWSGGLNASKPTDAGSYVQP